jgi:hypothetical protein
MTPQVYCVHAICLLYRSDLHKGNDTRSPFQEESGLYYIVSHHNNKLRPKSVPYVCVLVYVNLILRVNLSCSALKYVNKNKLTNH